MESDENIIHVMMRADFLTKVMNTNDTFCGNFFTKTPGDKLQKAFGIIMDKKQALSSGMKRFHARIDRCVRWYWGLGSPFHVLRNANWARVDWITFRAHVLMMTLAHDAGMTTLDDGWYLTEQKIAEYLKRAIEHDDVEEVEYMIENSPFPIDLNSVAKLSIENQYHSELEQKHSEVTSLTKWCLDRLLITFEDFSPLHRLDMKTREEWRELAKTYPAFDPEGVMESLSDGSALDE